MFTFLQFCTLSIVLIKSLEVKEEDAFTYQQQCNYQEESNSCNINTNNPCNLSNDLVAVYFT